MSVEILSNKKVLIIGATGGIGWEAAKLIKNSQAKLFISGRDGEKLSLAASELGIHPSRVFTMDITRPDEVARVAGAIHQGEGALDILINAAGIGLLSPLESLSYEDFSRVLDTNLKGAFNLMKAFLPPMKEARKGLVINIPGVLGKTPMAGAAAYSASKYGLEGMLKSIREELKRTEVRITNLYLGGVDSPFWDNIGIRANRDKFIAAKSAGRAIWFLCQQPASGVVSEMVIQPFNHQVI